MRRAIIAMLALAALCSPGAQAQERPGKKLVEYGWDVPFPDDVKEHVREMEKRPFDGILLRLREYNHAFDTRRWDETRLAPQIETLRGIEWRRFTDNFLLLNATDSWGMDWFDDGQWEAIAGNLRLEARAAKAGRCVGVAFDPEPYGPNPWAFPGPYPDRSFEQVASEVRKRGAQFLSALQGEMPGLRLLTLFQLGIFGDLVDEPDPAARSARLAGKIYALLPAFLNGMLDAAAPGTRIVDGNEPSYYYRAPEDYFQAYHTIRQRARGVVAPEMRRKYAAQVEAGMAVYLDYLLAIWRPADDFFNRYTSPADRLRWLEHDVYWALYTSDEYVWCYGEGVDWWAGKIPDGVEAAIRSARDKLDRGVPLGYDLKDVFVKARQDLDAAIASRVVARSASVPRLAPREKPPRLDGALQDPVWASRPPLEPFLMRARAFKDQPDAPTTAWVAYDDKALYLAFRCEEPDPAKLKAALQGTDQPGYKGEEIEVSIGLGAAARPSLTFVLNPGNVRRDVASADPAPPPLAAGAPAWRSAVKVGEKEWTAEVAIPWEAIGGRPAAGSTRRVNLCRDNTPAREVTCWSAVLDDPNEAEHMGEWKF
jgi:hypothetical protein